MHSLLLRERNKCYIFWVCIYSLSYPAHNLHVPYCHLWPVQLYSIFPHYLINCMIFRRTLLNTQCVFWFSLQLLLWTFLILRRNERDMIKSVCWSSCTAYTQKNGAVSKVNKKVISHLTHAQLTPSELATVQVSHGLPAACFSSLLWGRGASFQDGVAAGKGFLCAPFWGVQICDYSAAWVSCTV